MHKFFLILSVVLGIIIVTTAIILSQRHVNNPQNSGSPQSSSSVNSNQASALQDINVLGITPLDKSQLSAGQSQIFSVNFAQTIQINWVNISLTSKDITSQNPTAQNLAFDSSLTNNNRTLSIVTKSAIAPNTAYELVIQNNTKNNSQLLDAQYSTGNTISSPVPSNNPTLKQYLPYQAPNFTLEYLNSQNVYISHFIYDPNSSDNLQTQYQKAKSDATQFIQSKGIDINSIVIQWRYN